MEGSAFVLVRSVVANPDDRKPFDQWYQTDHIPLVFAEIANVNRIWRFWSKSDPSIHYSLSEFADIGEFERAAGSEGFKYIVLQVVEMKICTNASFSVWMVWMKRM